MSEPTTTEPDDHGRPAAGPTDAAVPTGDGSEPGAAPPPDDRLPGPEAAEEYDDAPLPVRIPGRNMSHLPLLDGEGPVAESDPLRPYRVHELLTRHDQGKRRGFAEAPAPEPPVRDAPVLEPVAEPHDSAPEGER